MSSPSSSSRVPTFAGCRAAVYMAALSLADTIFLLVLFFSWLGNFKVMIYHRNGACQIFTYTSMVAGFLSVWYVVCFTVERHLIVCFPLQRQVLCSPRRAKIVVAVFALTGLVIYNFGLWAIGLIELPEEPDQPVQYFCTVQQRYYSLVTSINNVDTFVTLIVPAFVITISNVRISYALSRFYRERNQNLLQGCPAPTASGGSNSPSNASLRLSISGPSCNRLQMRVTKMLLIVSTVFVVCNSPSHLVRIYAFGMEQLYTDYQHSEMLAVVQSITNLLYYAGFSTNFFLYNISGKTFRRAFCRLCRCSAHQVTSCMCVRVLKIKPRSNAYPMTRLKRFQIKEADRAGI